MKIFSCYPVLMTSNVQEAADFFRDHFAFQTTFEADWYVILTHRAGELAMLDDQYATVPSGFGFGVAGMLFNLEVDDVDEVYQRLVIDGPLTAIVEMRNEEFGHRHFTIRGPGQCLVDVITKIPPTGKFATSSI